MRFSHRRFYGNNNWWYDREPTDKELKGAIVGYGCTNIIGAFLGGLPTASYSQNVGIVTTTKVINRSVLGMSAGILLIAGLVPKFSALLTTIRSVSLVERLFLCLHLSQ